MIFCQNAKGPGGCCSGLHPVSILRYRAGNVDGSWLGRHPDIRIQRLDVGAII